MPTPGVQSNMRRIGFRRLLPLVLITLHVALITNSGRPIRSHHLARLSYHVAALQEVGGMPVDPITPPPLTKSQKIAVILNLPAVVVGSFIGALFSGGDIAARYAAAPVVALLWFSIGKWLDGVLGYIPRMHMHDLLRGFLGIPALLLLLVGIASLTPLNHHRNADSILIGIAFVLWPTLCLLIVSTSGAASEVHPPKSA